MRQFGLSRMERLEKRHHGKIATIVVGRLRTWANDGDGEENRRLVRKSEHSNASKVC